MLDNNVKASNDKVTCESNVKTAKSTSKEKKPKNTCRDFGICLLGALIDSALFVGVMVLGTRAILLALEPIIDEKEYDIHSFFGEVIGDLSLGVAPYILCFVAAFMIMRRQDGFFKDRLKNLASSLHGVIASIVGFKLVQIYFYDSHKSLEDGVLTLGIISLLVYVVFSAIDSSEIQKERGRQIGFYSIFAVICVLLLVKCSA